MSYVQVGEFPVHYEIYGTGSEWVILIPGALGTGMTDFRPQLEGEYAFDLKRYKFVAVELPGWGRSRPPKRAYGLDVYDIDAEAVVKIIQTLNISNCSIIGWSDGAKVAVLVGIHLPSRINSIVAAGLFTYCTRYNILPTIKTQRIENWDVTVRKNLLDFYGWDTLQALWDEHCNFCKTLQQKVNEFIIEKPELENIKIPVNEKLYTELHKVRCAVLLVHGDLDPLIGIEQQEHCLKRIANSRLKRFPQGSHNLHHTHPKEFRDLVASFLDESQDYF